MTIPMHGRNACLVTRLVAAGAIASSMLGCAPSRAEPEPAPVCLDAGVDTSCTPAYEPTYDALYANTFKPSCAASGVSCHASTGRQAGIDFGEPNAGYEGLTKSVVRPGQPECSVLVHVVLSTDGKVRMPPGRSLSAGEQCAIIQWIARGAAR